MPHACARRQHAIARALTRALGSGRALCAGLAIVGCSLDGEGTGTPGGASAEPADEAGVAPTGAVVQVDPEGAVQRPFDAGMGLPTSATDAAEPADQDATRSRAGGRGTDARTSPGAGPACMPSGHFALRIDFDVNWLGTSVAEVIPVIAPGSGSLTVFASAVLSGAQDDGKAVVRACGAVIPDFTAGDNVFFSERYGVYIPNESWEQPTMPTWTIAWRADCSAPGCAFRTSELDALLGGRRAAGARVFDTLVDDDADGRSGITLLTRGAPEISADGQPYVYPPLGWQLWARARKIMLAIGVRVGLDGALEGCERIAGRTAVGAVDTDALACSGTTDLAPGEIECDEAAVQFLGENLPAWTVRGGRFFAVRTGDSSCSAVRAALGR